MRYGTARVGGQATFLISATMNSPWVAYSEYASRFPQEKILKEVQTFEDFVKRFSVLGPQLQKNREILNSLTPVSVNDKDWLMPFRPVLFRDFYCFEEHVKNARKGRGLDIIPEWYEAPIFYYSNPLSFRGPFETIEYPKGSQEMDLELEIAAVVGLEIRNADLETARKAILGYCVLNDWTARDFQRFEMKVNMGPTKGKDFATSFGSYIISPDEIENLRVNKGYDIEFQASINGEVLTKRSWKDIQFSFEEMLVRASKNCSVFPTEVIASGTLGKGCLMEHNLGQDHKKWLKPGDTVTLEWLPAGPKIENKIVE